MAGPTMAANNFLLPNWTIVVEIIIFLLIFAILARFVVPKLQRALSGRDAMIRRQIEDSDEARKQLVAAEEAYQDALTSARTEAAQIREDAREEAQHTIDELRAQAQQESARIVARGEEQLAGQRAAIMRELRAQIGTVAVELSEKIVEQPLAQEPDVVTTVDTFLAGVAADDRARSGADS